VAFGPIIFLGSKSVAPASTAVPKPAAAKAAPLRPGCSFVHLQGASGDFSPIQSGYCLGRLSIIGNFHKRKPSGLPRLTVMRDVNARDLSERLKQRAQVAFRSLKTHVADENAFDFSSFPADRFLRSAFEKSAKLGGA
jgi:hypothetical protein